MSTDNRRPARMRRGHSHEQRTRVPMILLAVSVIGVLLVALQIFMFVQQRAAIRDAQNEQKNRQIASLQTEIRDRDLAIKRELARRDERNRKATCAIISSIPPDGGVVDAFRKSLKCGAYKPAKNSADQTSSTSSTSSSAQSASSPSSATTATPKRNMSSRLATSRPATSTGKTSTGGGSSPQPAPTPSPSPSPSPSPNDGGTVCLLGVCIL